MASVQSSGEGIRGRQEKKECTKSLEHNIPSRRQQKSSDEREQVFRCAEVSSFYHGTVEKGREIGCAKHLCLQLPRGSKAHEQHGFL